MGRSLTRYQEPLTLLAAVVVLLALIAPPLAATVFQALTAPTDIWDLLVQPRLLELLARSVGLALCTTLATLLFGVPLAVLLECSRVRLPAVALFLHTLPLALPPFITALAAFHLFGQQGWWGSSASATWLFSPMGLIAVLTLCLTPVITLLTWLGLRGTEPSGNEAARCIAGPRRALWKVAIPQVAPSITLGAIIVFVLSLAEFAVPSFLRVDVYSASVFARLGGFAYAPAEATALAIPLLVISALLWMIERSIHVERVVVLPRSRTSRTTLLDGPVIFGIASVCAILAAAIGIAPLVILSVIASQGEGFALMWNYLGDALENSLTLASSVSTLAVAVSLVFATAIRNYPKTVAAIDAIAWMSFILPPALLALGAITIWNRAATQWIYGSAVILVLVLTARYLSFSLRMNLAAERQLSPSQTEAARTLGAGYWHRLVRIDMPGLRRSLVGAWLLVFVFSLRDMETTALVYPPGGEPLTVRIFTLEANGPPAVVAALAVMQALLTTLPLMIAALAFRPRS